jgi:hypothetical protein
LRSQQHVCVCRGIKSTKKYESERSVQLNPSSIEAKFRVKKDSWTGIQTFSRRQKQAKKIVVRVILELNRRLRRPSKQYKHI